MAQAAVALTRQSLRNSDDVNMRLSVGLSWASLFLAAQTYASDAYIYLSEASDISSPRTILPDATRLLLARRLGLSRYHGLEGADEPVLEILNEFGGQQKPLLFSGQQEPEPRRNLIIIEDVGNVGGEDKTTTSVLHVFLISRQNFSTPSVMSPRSSCRMHQTLPKLFALWTTFSSRLRRYPMKDKTPVASNSGTETPSVGVLFRRWTV